MELAHFGTFDVDNYGDLLFPKIIEWRIPSATFQHVSPTNLKTRFADAVLAQDTLDRDADGYIIGGGNIVNFRNSTLAEYKGRGLLAYTRLSARPVALAAAKGKPCVINSPSISASDHTFLENSILRKVLSVADYAAFRDKPSVALAQSLARKEIHLVPDTALDISRMWPYGKAQAEPSEKYIIAHINKRYGGRPEEAAKALDTLARKTGFAIVLLPIGPCHGDIEYSQMVSGMMEEPVSIFSNFRLQAFAHAIAGSELYIGSSMHGFITALSYQVPARLVLGQQVFSKFYGVLDAARLSTGGISRTWLNAVAQEGPQERIEKRSLDDIFERLDRHWAAIGKVLAEGHSASAAVSENAVYRAALASHVLRKAKSGVRKVLGRS